MGSMAMFLGSCWSLNHFITYVNKVQKPRNYQRFGLYFYLRNCYIIVDETVTMNRGCSVIRKAISHLRSLQNLAYGQGRTER